MTCYVLQHPDGEIYLHTIRATREAVTHALQIENGLDHWGRLMQQGYHIVPIEVTMPNRKGGPA